VARLVAPAAITTILDQGDEMTNALDVFREQQDAAKQLHAQLVEVAALIERLQAQIAGIANDRDLREVLREERLWLEAAQRATDEAHRWRIEEQRRHWPGVAYRWITALAFALLSAVAVGTGYGWIAKPYANELEALRPHAELGQLVEQRMTTMTPTERRQLDALMKWKRVSR
jgi:hypothetical protein